MRILCLTTASANTSFYSTLSVLYAWNENNATFVIFWVLAVLNLAVALFCAVNWLFEGGDDDDQEAISTTSSDAGGFAREFIDSADQRGYQARFGRTWQYLRLRRFAFNRAGSAAEGNSPQEELEYELT
jgi:hypothetical protein